MKKIFLFLVCFSFLSVHAQEEIKEKKGRAYFTLKTGYSFPVAKTTVGSPKREVGMLLSVENQETGEISQKNAFGTRGAGFTVAGAVGYMFTKNFGLEMEFSYLRSTKILDAKRDETAMNGLNYFAEQYSYTNMFRAAPMLVVSGDPDKKFTPYAKFGLLVPLAGKTTVEVNIVDETGELANQLLPVLDNDLYNTLEDEGLSSIPIATESYIKAKTAGQFSLGFASRIGATYNISNNWSIFAELEFNMLTIKAKETKFVDFSSKPSEELLNTAETLLGYESGTLKREYTLNDIPEILRLTVYQNEITEDSNTTYDYARKDEPYEQLTFRDSYNSFGIMLGFKYKFGK